jgi:hypothetical protein
MYKSSRQQLLMNYFDSHMVRTRENSVCLDAQLLNVAACGMDDAALRYSREIKSLELPLCPTGIDNNGIYYSAALDPNYTLAPDATTLNSLTGIRDNVSYTLTPYDDRLPVPAGYKLDSSRVPIKVNNPVIATFTGLAGSQTGFFITLSNDFNVTLPISNKLSFWLDSNQEPVLFVDIAITGVPYPQSPWNASKPLEIMEEVQMSSDGYVETVNNWVSITNITVRNLPTASVLTCRSINFNLSHILDDTRPVSLAGFRGVTFNRYWSVNLQENLLKEQYLLDNLSGLVYYQSYNLSQSVSCLALEPNTWGGLLGGGTNLYYFDKREPMPNLAGTGLKTEPCYGLDVYYDITRPGNARNAVIRPVPYKNANTVSKYRIVIQNPDNSQIVLLQDGSYLPLNSGVGWFVGQPKTTNLLLNQIGLYTITLQCIDSTGTITFDIFPYENFDVSTIIKGTYDLSSLVVKIVGIAYDFLGQLWVYDGVWAVPIAPYYNGYVLDPLGRMIYMTDSWDQITYQ